MSISGSQRLQGRIAFISGGLRGIGLAIAERYLAEGAEVVLSDLDAPDSEHASAIMARLGQAASYVQADVTKEDDWLRARDAVRAQHGKLHILVNNAGIELAAPVETTTMKDWRRIMDINVDGVFLGVKTFTAMLAESGTGIKGGSSIINVSSIMGIVGLTDVSAYIASKGAVRLFTKGIAVEFAQKKKPIRANSIHPGFVNTGLLQSGARHMVETGNAEKPQDLLDVLIAQTPLGRLGDPADLAGGAFFLASEDSAFMTGAELVMDG